MCIPTGPTSTTTMPTEARHPLREVAAYFLKLGWLAFGGPVGQVGLMHLEVVERRRWIDEDEFLRALNFCHVLPGPEATQLAIYIGWRKAGWIGGVLAGLLFILPGFLTLSLLGWLYVHFGQDPRVLSVLWGFRPVGLALLLAALVRISRATLKTPLAAGLAVAAFAAFFLAGLPFPVVLIGCGLAALAAPRLSHGPVMATVLGALLALPGHALAAESAGKRLADISWFFLKVGLFSFGGAYAVLPYLRAGSVGTYGWITDHQMIDALALGETTPGPLISIGTFVGFLAGDGAQVPWWGAVAATFWLFLPSFVFVLGAVRHMDRLVALPGVKPFLKGVTCAVVGLMFSISIPMAQVATTPGGRFDPLTLALGLAAFTVVQSWRNRLNVVAVVLGGGALGLLRALRL